MGEVTLTILGGVSVFVLGQVFLKFLIEPLHDLRKFRGEIANTLIFYANVYCNPGIGPREEMDEAQKVLRQQASQLLAKAHALPWYGLWAFLRAVPSRKNILEASGCLIGLSNSVHDRSDARGEDSNSKRRREIEQLLKLYTAQ